MITLEYKSRNKSKTKPTSKYLNIFFIIIQIVFSLDFGFVKYKSSFHMVLVKLCSIILTLLIGVVVVSTVVREMTLVYVFWYVKYIIEHYIYVFTLMFVRERNSFGRFLQHLQWIDLQMKTDNASYSFDIKIVISCIASFAYKLILTAIYCIYQKDCLGNTVVQMILTIPVLSIDVPLIVLYFVFYATNIRLIALKKALKNKVTTPRDGQYLYKYLVDYTENVKTSLDPIFIVTLLINIPSLMAVIYQVIKDMKFVVKNPLGPLVQICTVTALTMVIFAPAISASPLASEAYKIKVILHDILYDEKDSNKMDDIQRFINYIEARPFKFTILRIIHLDATLPVVLINLCITYLIVLLQLTHLF